MLSWRQCTTQFTFFNNYAKYSPIWKEFHWLPNKPVLIWLLTIPPHLKYVTTVPCNFLFINAPGVCDCRSFSDINASQATLVRCGGIFNNLFAGNLLENLTEWKTSENRLRIRSCPWVHFVWPNPIQPISWLTQPNPLKAEKFGLNLTQPNTTSKDRFPVPERSAVKSHVTAWCNQILSNRALSELTQPFQIF